jgi:hypothetical protein
MYTAAGTTPPSTRRTARWIENSIPEKMFPGKYIMPVFSRFENRCALYES